MSKITLSGNASGTGTVTLASPNTDIDRTLTLPDTTGTLVTLGSTLTLATAVTASGTSVDFTSIPSWVKRITVMFNGVSTNGTANFFLQLGSGSPITSGYLGATASVQNAGTTATMINNNGLGVIGGGGNVVLQGAAVFSLLNAASNAWVGTHAISRSDAAIPQFGSTAISLSGVLDQVRVTTSNGTDTFDAGTINIMYEG